MILQRQDFLDGLVAQGWATYEDQDGLGWSILYPPDWRILPNTSEQNAAFESPHGGQLIVLHAPSPGDDVTSSVEFLAGQLGAAAEQQIAESIDEVIEIMLQVEPPEADQCHQQEDCRSWFIDINYGNDLGFTFPEDQDIVAAQVTMLVDPWNFDPISAESKAKSWWYGYQDPESTEDVAFLLFTYNHDPTLEALVDDMVRSFEPPDGYPHLDR